ncbi:MAG TPA: TolC family protein [Mucilaginibacter sp.]|jgi:outer membrane protein
MRFSKFLLTLLFFTCGFFANAQQKYTLTLQQCLDTAIKNNLNVKQNGLFMEQNRIYFNQAKDNLLPSVSGNINRMLSQGRGLSSVTNTYVNQSQTSDNYSLGASLTIFNGLALQNAIKQASLAYQAGKMDFQSAKDLVTVNIITNYLLILDAEEILGSAKSQLAVAKENVNISEIREKEGANKVASDFTDFKGAYAGNQVAVVQAQNSLDAAKLSLFQLMNIPYNKDAEFQPLNAQDLTGQYGASADQVYETALQQLAVVKAATFRRESAEKGVKVAKGQLLPTLSVNGNLTTNYSSNGQKSVFIDSTVVPTGAFINTPAGRQGVFATQANYTNQDVNYLDQFKNNYGTSLTLGLYIPIFTNHFKKNAVALAKITLLNERYIEDNVKVTLRQNVEQAYYNMAAAYNRYQALDAQVKAYTESYRISKIRLDAGVITSTDFIIAKNNLDGATLNLIGARYDYFIYSKILDYYQGKLSL